MSLHRFHRLTLSTLIDGILTHKTHTTVHLREILRTEDEHKLIMYSSIAMHVSHRFLESVLTVSQFPLEITQLKTQCLDVTIEGYDITTDSIDSLTFIADFRIDNHQILKPGLNILLILTESTLLLLHLLLQLLTLILEPLNSNSRLLGLCLFCLLLLYRLFLTRRLRSSLFSRPLLGDCFCRSPLLGYGCGCE